MNKLVLALASVAALGLSTAAFAQNPCRADFHHVDAEGGHPVQGARSQDARNSPPRREAPDATPQGHASLPQQSW